MATLKDRIVQTLDRNPQRRMAAPEIAKSIGVKYPISGMLFELLQDRKIARPEYGLYQSKKGAKSSTGTVATSRQREAAHAGGTSRTQRSGRAGGSSRPGGGSERGEIASRSRTSHPVSLKKGENLIVKDGARQWRVGWSALVEVAKKKGQPVS